MAGKLSIRRVGNFLPSMCLAGVLLVIAVLIWLCTAGIPDCALRYLEEEAARNGINLKIEKIRLSPSSGLAAKAEGVEVTLEQPGAAPLALKTRKVQVAFSLSRMLTGTFYPANIHLVDGALNIPLSEAADDAIAVQDVDIYTVFHRNGKGINTDIKANLNQISLETRILIRNTEELINELKAQEEEPANADSADQLTDLRNQLKQLRRQLEGQNWNKKSHPHIKLSLIHRDAWRAELDASVPDYQLGRFLIKDALLSADLKDQTVTINKLSFRTVNPDTTVSLQGGYDWQARELEFNTRSTAPLVRLAYDYVDEKSQQFLRRLNTGHDDTPTIELSGSASLAEDYALNAFTLRGKIEHNNLVVGSTPVQHALLSFFMQDGRFNLDAFKLQMENGFVSATASAEGESGHAEIDISLPDETMLALARDLSGDNEIALPEGIDFDDNLHIRVQGDMQLAPFEPGKTHVEDLVPTVRAGHIQINTGKTNLGDTELQAPAITLDVQAIDYSGENIIIGNIKLDAKLGRADNTEQHLDADDIVVNVQLDGLELPQACDALSIQRAALRASATLAEFKSTRLEKLHTTAELANISVAFGNVAETLGSDAIDLQLHADSFSHTDVTARGIHLDADIPEGLHLADAWQNMQKNSHIEAGVLEISRGTSFTVRNTRLTLKNTAENMIAAEIIGSLDEENLAIQGTATLLDDEKLRLDALKMRIPAASLKPLWGGEPLAELKLPKLVEAQGNALINTSTGAVENCHYQVNIPELVRVCNNVYVHKGMEIPLALSIDGNLTTAADGSMRYEADVNLGHELGKAELHITGDPLKECHITGNNTITVNIINALIDNADAHWIMRDFRCTPGVTRNVVSNINTTIRYDKGIYVHALCDAALYDMEFLLGALRDKEDADGNPTGEEYLRTDLSSNPYSKIKEGHCGVEVLVQMDCVDDQGNPLPERLRINLNNPDLLYDNRPWLKRMGFKKGATTSRITGEAVRFNIENNTISLHKLKGHCYPAYSIGMFYAPIQHFMEDIILRDPVDIETDYCIFPLSRNCEVPMQGLIRTEAATGAGFKFLGTTIPFTNFSGFIKISDVDVYLDRMNAQCWGGALNGALCINFAGKHTTLDGYFVASNMNLKDIVASYGVDFTPATCNGYIRFQAARPTLEDVRGYGQVHLTDGDLMQIGLFRPIGALLSDMPGHLSKLQESVKLKKEEAPPSWADKVIRSLFDTGSSAIDTMQDSAYKLPFANHFLRYGIDEAFAKFDISNGHLISRDMKAKGYNLDVGVQLDIDLDKLTLTGDLWPRISSVPTVLISPITILSDFLIDINLYGDLVSPQWEFGLSKKLKSDDSSLSPEPQNKDKATKKE